MDKYAFFVEGYTEALFVENVLKILVGQNNLSYELQSVRGGSSCPIRIIKVRELTSENDKFFFLIRDCGGETNVKSYLLEQRESLIRAGYKKLCGIRDVYPNFARTDIPRLNRLLLYRVPQTPISIKFILSIMEMESWMIAEWTFFQRYNSNLTLSLVNSKCGIDVSSDNTELIDEPANKVNGIFTTIGQSYQKGCSEIVNLLDFDEICLNTRNRIPSLEELCAEIESYLA